MAGGCANAMITEIECLAQGFQSVKANDLTVDYVH